MAAFSFSRPLYEFLCLLDFRHGPVGTPRRKSFLLVFRVFRNYDGWLIVHRRLPPQSFARQVVLVPRGKPSFFGFDVFTKAPAIHENPNVLSGVLFSELVKLFGLEKLISCGEKAVVGQNLPPSQGVVKYVENLLRKHVF